MAEGRDKEGGGEKKDRSGEGEERMEVEKGRRGWKWRRGGEDEGGEEEGGEDEVEGGTGQPINILHDPL